MRNDLGYLLETDVRYAASHSKNNQEAARFLNISINTWKKYAKMYFDSSTGKTYYEALKNVRSEPKTPSIRKLIPAKITLGEISDGLHPKYTLKAFTKRLLKEGIKQECCSSCGFNERNLLTGKVPLHLTFEDGNKKNWQFNNLNFLCYNCCALLTELKIFVR